MEWSGALGPPMTALVKNFEKAYPKVNVQLQIVPGASQQTVLQPEIQAGNPPDLAYTCPGEEAPYCITPLGPGAANKLSPITGPWTAQVPASVTKPLTIDGKLYAAPLGIAAEVVFYNKQIFQSLGLQPPTQFSQLLTVCRRIAASGKTPFAFMAPITTPSYFLDMASTKFVYAQDPNWLAQKVAGKASFATTPGWQRVLQAWMQMKSAGCFSAGAAGSSITQGVTDVAQGNAAMMMASSDGYGSAVAENPKLQLGAFDFPGDTPSERGTTFGVIWNVDVFAQGHNPTAARAFVNFIEQPAQLAIFDKAAGLVSVPDWAAGKLPSYLSGIEPDLKYRALSQPSSGYPSTTWVTTVDPSMVSLLTGQVSITQELHTMDQSFSG